MISNKGVRKSTNEVIKGIKKLLGSLPLLNKIIALMKSTRNIIQNNAKIVINTIKITKKGCTILIPIEKPIA